jgi:hypothetical protein
MAAAASSPFEKKQKKQTTQRLKKPKNVTPNKSKRPNQPTVTLPHHG